MGEPTNDEIMEDNSTNNWFRQPPIQRQKWGDTQVLPHVNWGDLFFDLFYVAGAYNLAYIIKTDPNFMSFLYFLGCFGPIKNMWDSKLMYDSKYQTPDDVLHMVTDIFQLCIIATAVLHIRPVVYMSAGTSNPEMFSYALAILVGYTYHILKYLEIRFWGVIGQKCSKYGAMTSVMTMLPSYLCVLAATIYSGVVFFGGHDDHGHSDDHVHGDDHHDRFLSGLVELSPIGPIHHIPIILLFASWLISHLVIFPLRYIRGKGEDFKKYSVPINVDFVIHRNGEWSMLMLGESVLSLLISEVVDEINEFYVTFYAGILTVTLLQYLYFKSRPEHADGHAMKRSRKAGYAFQFLMSCYSASLIVVGVGFKMLSAEFKYEAQAADSTAHGGGSHLLFRLLAGGGTTSQYSLEDRRQRISYYFCIGLACVFLFLDLMNLSHKGIKASLDRMWSSKKEKILRVEGILIVVVGRIATIVFIATACIYISDPEVVAVAGFACVSLRILIQILGKIYFPSEKHGHGHQGHHGVEKDEESLHFKDHP